MRRLLKYLPIVLGLMFASSACVVSWDDDDDWHDNRYHNQDWQIENYLRTGYWYPEYKSGLTPCEYDSYFYFDGSWVYFYNCHNERYDSGTFEVWDGYLTIRYRNGDRMRYDVIEWNCDHLVLRADDGTEFFYERHY